MRLKNSKGSVVIKKYYDDIASYLRKPDYLVIKAHGCVDDTQKLYLHMSNTIKQGINMLHFIDC